MLEAIRMKYIISIIQPSKLEQVHESLKSAGILGMTVSEVQGYGKQMGKSETYRGAEYTVNFVPKTKIEVAVDDDAVEAAVNAIKAALKEGNYPLNERRIAENFLAIEMMIGNT